MTLTEAHDLLKDLKPEFLDGLTREEQTTLLEDAKLTYFEPGALITNQGLPAEHLVLLLQGRARFTCSTITGRKINLHWIFPGEICGIASLLQRPCDYVLTAEAVRPTTALVWRHSAIRAFASRSPRIVDNGLSLAYEYIHHYQAIHICATGQTARQRLALALGTMAEGLGRKSKDGIEIHIRNEDLANTANVTIFTVSRLLSEWQRKGLLVKTRGMVILRSREDLLRGEL